MIWSWNVLPKWKSFCFFLQFSSLQKVMSTVAMYQIIGFAVPCCGRVAVLADDKAGRMLALDNHMRHFNNKISTMASWAVPPWRVCWGILHLSVGCGFVTADIVSCTNFQLNYSWFPSFHEKQEINSGTCLQHGVPITRLIYQTWKKICMSLLHSWRYHKIPNSFKFADSVWQCDVNYLTWNASRIGSKSMSVTLETTILMPRNEVTRKSQPLVQPLFAHGNHVAVDFLIQYLEET